MSNTPKIVLLEGDPYLARDRLTSIKRALYKEQPSESEWVVFDLPEDKGPQKEFISSGLDRLGAEIIYPTWDGTLKTVVVRNIYNDQTLLLFLCNAVSTLPEGVVLIIWDESGIIASEKSKDIPSWKGLRKLCSEKGKVFNFGEPLSSYGVTDNDRVSFVVSEAAKRNKKISGDDALSILSAVGTDRGILITEVEKLSFVSSGDYITRQDIEENVTPLSLDFPSWKFDSAFNSGKERNIIEAANMLISDELSVVKWDYCMILGLAIKMARWHIIVANAAAHGLDMVSELSKFSSGGYTAKDIKGLPSHAFLKEVDKDCLGRPPNPYSQSDIISFVRGLISRHSSALEAYNTTLDNYLWLYNAHTRSRTASEEEAKAIFNQAIFAYANMVPIKELFDEEKNRMLEFI